MRGWLGVSINVTLQSSATNLKVSNGRQTWARPAASDVSYWLTAFLMERMWFVQWSHSALSPNWLNFSSSLMAFSVFFFFFDTGPFKASRGTERIDDHMLKKTRYREEAVFTTDKNSPSICVGSCAVLQIKSRKWILRRLILELRLNFSVWWNISQKHS